MCARVDLCSGLLAGSPPLLARTRPASGTRKTTSAVVVGSAAARARHRFWHRVAALRRGAKFFRVVHEREWEYTSERYTMMCRASARRPRRLRRRP